MFTLYTVSIISGYYQYSLRILSVFLYHSCTRTCTLHYVPLSLHVNNACTYISPIANCMQESELCEQASFHAGHQSVTFR